MVFFTENTIENAKKRVEQYNKMHPRSQLSVSSVKLRGKKDKDGYGTYSAKKK